MSERDSRATPDGAGAAAARPPEASAVASNYSYWRETGEAWADEYERRKKHIISLHIQEVMLTDYVLQHAVTASSSLKVLDYAT